MRCAIADPRCTLTCQISSGSVYPDALGWRKTPICAVFWTSAFSVVANWQQSVPKIWRTNSDVLKRVEQTGKQTDKQTDKKLNVFGHPGGG